MQVLEGGVKQSFSPQQIDSTHIPDFSLAKLQIATHLEPSEWCMNIQKSPIVKFTDA